MCPSRQAQGHWQGIRRRAFTSATFTYTAEDADGTTLDLTFTIVVAAAAVTDAVFTITPEVLQRLKQAKRLI